MSEQDLSENEYAAALAAALYQFGTDSPGNIGGVAQGLAANYRYQRDRLARIAAGTPNPGDLDVWPDDSYVERDHVYVSRYLGRGLVRRFLLVRDVDETGISGTGIVAEGVTYRQRGQAAMYWRTAHSRSRFCPLRESELRAREAKWRTRDSTEELASLIVKGCSLVWRGHYSGGAVLEDIGGEAVTADLPAVNGRLYLRCVARDREERAATT